MVQKLKQHYFPILVIGGVAAGCIYTGNWLPFFIMLGVFALVGIIVGTIYLLMTKFRKVDIYIIEGQPDRHYVPDERFKQEHDETLH